MLHPSTKKLIDRLAEMTAQRKINWALGELDNSIVYETEGYRVLLEGKPASLRLTDALGSELETANPEQLKATDHPDGGTYAKIVEDLHTEALRIARGTETAISAVLQGLSDEAIQSTAAPLKTAKLAPSEDEKAEAAKQPDIVEDIADEAGISPSKIDGGIPDVGKAVATLADQVNGTKELEPAPKPQPTTPPAIAERAPTPATTTVQPPAVNNAPAPQPQPQPPIEQKPVPTTKPVPKPEAPTPASRAPAQPLPPPPAPPQPAPAQTAPATPRRSGGGGFGGFSDLSAYRPKSAAPASAPPPPSPAPVAKEEPPAPTPTVPEKAPAGPTEAVRTSTMPSDVRAVLDDVTATPPDGPPQPPTQSETPQASPPASGATTPVSPPQAAPNQPSEALSLSGLTAGLGLGSVSPQQDPTTNQPTAPSQPATEPPAHGAAPEAVEPEQPTEGEETDPEDKSGNGPGSRFNPWM